MTEIVIEYPCDWHYKVIGANDGSLATSIHEALVDVEYRLSESNRSGKGKYLSLEVVACVQDEPHRYRIYNRLRSLGSVKLVL